MCYSDGIMYGISMVEMASRVLIVLDGDLGHCRQIIGRYRHFVRKEFLLGVAFIGFQDDRNLECFTIAFACIQM